MDGEFTRFGIVTGRIANADNSEKLAMSVIRATQDNETYATFLAETLKMKLELQTEENAATDSGSTFIRILLGKDYTYSPLQSLLPLQ